MFFTFPEDARWNAKRPAVEFGVEIGEPCVGTTSSARTRFESIAERKLRRRQLTEDGNVEIIGRDLRYQKEAQIATVFLAH